MSEPTESTLAVRHWLEQHLAGDDAARDALIQVSMRRLRLLARKILSGTPAVRQMEETDDVLQNSVVRLWKSLADARPATPLDYFRLAACVIRRELIDLSRHQRTLRAGTFRTTTQNSEGDSAFGNDQKVSAAFHASEDTFDPLRLSQWTEFHEYVEQLPEIERSLFDLLWYQGLTLQETSELLDIPERTLRRRWNAVRIKLGRALLPNEDRSETDT